MTKRKIIIIVGAVLVYLLVGVLYIRMPIDSDVFLDYIRVNENFDVGIGKTIYENRNRGVITIYNNDETVCSYYHPSHNSFFSEVVANNNHIIALAHIKNNNNITSKISIVEINTSCEVIKSNELDFNNEVVINDVIAVQDGYIIIGINNSSSFNNKKLKTFGYYDYLSVKLDKKLSVVNYDTFGSSNSDFLNSAVLVDNDIIAVGNMYFDDELKNDLGITSISKSAIIKIDSQGNFLKESLILQGQNSKNSFSDIIVYDDSIYIVGSSENSNSSLQGVVYKYTKELQNTSVKIFNDIKHSTNFLKIGAVEDRLYILTDLEFKENSEMYGKLEKNFIIEMDLEKLNIINIQNINNDLFIKSISSYNNILYISGYGIIRNIIKSDCTNRFYGSSGSLEEFNLYKLNYK